MSPWSSYLSRVYRFRVPCLPHFHMNCISLLRICFLHSRILDHHNRFRVFHKAIGVTLSVIRQDSTAAFFQFYGMKEIILCKNSLLFRIDIRQKHLKSFLQLNFFMNAVIAVRLKKRPLAILKNTGILSPATATTIIKALLFH